MTEETAIALTNAINNLAEQLSKPMIMYREDIQREYNLGRDTVDKMFKDPNLKVQQLGKKDFVSIEGLNEYFTKHRHKRNSI